MKKCACCLKEHSGIPKTAKFSHAAIVPGWYFECDGVKENGERCNSTMVWPLTREDKYISELKKAIDNKKENGE